MQLIKTIGVICLLAIVSCTSSKTPESVVNDFYEAVVADDYEKAKTFATEDSKSFMDNITTGIEMAIGSAKLKNVDCETKEETSVCDCFIEGKDKPLSVNLKKENDEWKVDVNKTFQKAVGNEILDLIKGETTIGGIAIDLLTGEDNINSLVEKFSGSVGEGSEVLNNILKQVDAEDLAKHINGATTSLSSTYDLLEEKGLNLKDALKKLEEIQKEAPVE